MAISVKAPSGPSAGIWAPYPIPGTSSLSQNFGGQFARRTTPSSPSMRPPVCAHEYGGYDLGLPDENTTPLYTGKGTSGDLVYHVLRLLGRGHRRHRADRSPPGPRSSCRPPSAATGCNGSNVQLRVDLNPAATSTCWIRPTTRGCNDDVVRINLPAKHPAQPAYAGQYQYHGEAGQQTSTTA